MRCKWCGTEVKGLQGLGRHLAHKNKSKKEYYIQHIGDEEESKCDYCGNECTFRGLGSGFPDHCDLSCSTNDAWEDEEIRKKREEGMRGRTFTEEHKQKLSEAKQNEEARERGRKHLKKAREAWDGPDEEHKQKLREANKNRNISEQTKQKISQTVQELWQDDKYVEKMKDSGNIFVNPPSGKNHPSWKENTESIGRGENWHIIREETIQKDEEQCYFCGLTREEHKKQVGCDLDVHHIKPVSRFMDDDGNVDFDLANKKDNLVTACRSCHASVENLIYRIEDKLD